MADPRSQSSNVNTVKQHWKENPWCMRRRVLPQHTDLAGVMWHGAYVAWLEEARVEALAEVGLAYSDLAERGLSLPVVELAIVYRRPLRHGDVVQVCSQLLPPRGVRLPWASRFLDDAGRVAAEARVELVPLETSPQGERQKVLRHLPGDLEQAIQALLQGPGPAGAMRAGGPPAP
jgi:acyl-CoA thioester hydrolase